MSDDSDSSLSLIGTHVSDDEADASRTRKERTLRAADPEKQPKFAHAHLQEPTDAQGRKRFHGAFTGGFSAGFYNTVGSAEGWEPSEWRSSRDARGASERAAPQRAEDFMDEEDLADLRGPGALVARTGFAKSRAAEAAAGAAGRPAPSASGGGFAAELARSFGGQEAEGGGRAAASAAARTGRHVCCHVQHT